MIRILAEADPVGLIAGGASPDEYAAEAEAILSLQGVPKVTEITGVFAVSFSDPGACTREKARWIAEQMATLGRSAETGKQARKHQGGAPRQRAQRASQP